MSATQKPRKVVNMPLEYRKKIDALLATFELPPTITTLFSHLIDAELNRRGIDPKSLKPKAPSAA